MYWTTGAAGTGVARILDSPNYAADLLTLHGLVKEVDEVHVWVIYLGCGASRGAVSQ